MSTQFGSLAMERKEAAEFVSEVHRHHAGLTKDKFRVGATRDGKLVSVVQVGRPNARMLCDGRTLEVVRLCTDGTPNACSHLYAKAARVARELGYEKIITYILEGENGMSLRAAGWRKAADTVGQSWSRPSRPRSTVAPTCNKQRWEKLLVEE